MTQGIPALNGCAPAHRDQAGNRGARDNRADGHGHGLRSRRAADYGTDFPERVDLDSPPYGGEPEVHRMLRRIGQAPLGGAPGELGWETAGYGYGSLRAPSVGSSPALPCTWYSRSAWEYHGSKSSQDSVS